jgi:hypothetical protein
VLSPGNRWAVSVARWFGWGTAVFRTPGSETVCRGGGLDASRCRAWVSSRRRLDAVPVCVKSGAGRGVVALERQHAPRALGGSAAFAWHGRGASHGRSRAEQTRGIDPGVQS